MLGGLVHAEDRADPASPARAAEAIAIQSSTGTESARTQTRIDDLDDTTRAALDAYRVASAELDALEAYNAQLERLIRDREVEHARIVAQLEEVEVTRREILPLTQKMLDLLASFVELDAPFLEEERGLRLASLADAMNRADVSEAERFRMLMDAYRVEADYGRTVEAYRAPISSEAGARTVDVLRFGRVGLYSLSLDGQDAGFWDPRSRSWVALDDAYRARIRRGLAMARSQAPPALVRLPVVTTAAEEDRE